MKRLLCDMAHCSGEGCLLKDTCLRFLDKGEGCLQIVMMTVPPIQDGKCDMYIEVNP